jgi:hypothetical protein
MSKERRQKLLQELEALENEVMEEPVDNDAAQSVPTPTPTDCIDGAVQAQKKPRTAKQLEAFEKAKAIRDANYAKRKAEADHNAAQERKALEEKLVKKAIAVKKKQIKQQKLLDEISSDDDTKPIQAGKPKVIMPSGTAPTTPSLPPPVKIKFF